MRFQIGFEGVVMEYIFNGELYTCQHFVSSRDALSLAGPCPADHWCEWQNYFYRRENRTIIDGYCSLIFDQVGDRSFENVFMATNITCYGADPASAAKGLLHWISHGRPAVISEFRRRLCAGKFEAFTRDYWLDAPLTTKRLAYKLEFDFSVHDRRVDPDELAWEHVLAIAEAR